MSTRKYKCSDVVMLVVLNSIAESLLANMADLSAVRLNWNAAYGTDFKTRIAFALQNYLGLDPKKVLRSATSDVYAIQEPALRDIAFLKSQLTVDFARKPKVLEEMLRTLGFTQYLGKTQKGNHESLIAFLQMFSKNLTDDIRNAIAEKGTDPQLLNRIAGYAEPFAVADMKQESLKTTTKEIPAESIDKLNDLYMEGIGICKIASKYYISSPIKKEQFSFNSLLSKVRVQQSKENPGGETKNSSK